MDAAYSLEFPNAPQRTITVKSTAPLASGFTLSNGFNRYLNAVEVDVSNFTVKLKSAHVKVGKKDVKFAALHAWAKAKQPEIGHGDSSAVLKVLLDLGDAMDVIVGCPADTDCELDFSDDFREADCTATTATAATAAATAATAAAATATTAAAAAAASTAVTAATTAATAAATATTAAATATAAAAAATAATAATTTAAAAAAASAAPTTPPAATTTSATTPAPAPAPAPAHSENRAAVTKLIAFAQDFVTATACMSSGLVGWETLRLVTVLDILSQDGLWSGGDELKVVKAALTWLRHVSRSTPHCLLSVVR